MSSNVSICFLIHKIVNSGPTYYKFGAMMSMMILPSIRNDPRGVVRIAVVSVTKPQCYNAVFRI